MTALSETELRQARRSITMIFQSFNLLMQRTVLQNVCLPMAISGIPKARQKERALELLELVGLADKAGALPPPSSPAARNSGWPLPVPWPRTPRCCCATRPPPPWTPTTTASILGLLRDLNQKLGVTVVVITPPDERH